MTHSIVIAAQIIMSLLALKALIWGCGGPTLRGWNDVVRREKGRDRATTDGQPITRGYLRGTIPAPVVLPDKERV